MSASFTDWIALSPDYSIVETPMPVKWSGKTLQELDVRRNYEVNVVGIKSGAHVEVNPDPSVSTTATLTSLPNARKREAKMVALG